MARKSPTQKKRGAATVVASRGHKCSASAVEPAAPRGTATDAVSQVGGAVRRTVGSFLRSARESQRLSQEQLAAMTGGSGWGVSRAAIGAVERGRSLPSLEALVTLSRVLHFEPTEVLERVDLAATAPLDLTGISLEQLGRRAYDYFWESDFRRAAATYDVMLERLALDPPADREKLEHLRSGIELRRAAALRRCGALLSAEAAAKRSISLRGGGRDVQAQAYALLAKIEVQRGFLPLATVHAQKAVELAEGCEDRVLARALLEKGDVLFASDDFEAAKSTFLEARDLLMRARDEKHLSHAEGNIGLCHARLRDPGKARTWFGRALDLARAQRFPSLEARWLTELGRLALEQGDPEEADRLATAAARVARSNEDPIGTFRAEWVRHLVAVARDSGIEDRQRLGLLRRLLVRVGDHVGEQEVQEFLAETREEPIAKRSRP